MATILGRITVNGIDLLEVDQDPTLAGGTAAPVGSVASDSSTGTLWSKTGALDTDWTQVGTGAGSGVQTTFVYRPGGVASDNVYTDWALLMADLVTVEGPKIVELDNRFGAITIPAGGPYDMRDTTIRGRLLSGTPVVATVDPGASFENLERLEWLRLDYTSGTPAMVVPAGIQYIRLWGASIQNSGAAPFFDVTTPGAVLLSQLGNASGFNPFGGASPVVDLGGSGLFAFALDEASTNGVDTVSGTAGSTLTVTLRDASAIFEEVTAPTFTGTFSGVTLRPLARNTSYDPLFFPSGLTSTTVQGAIDELATGASSNIVEYVPGNPGPLRGNQYTTWADVHAAAVRLQPSTIMVDDTDGAAEIPAGAWDMEGITLSAEITSDLLPIPVLTALDGATLTNLGSVSGPLTLTTVSLSPVITAPAGVSWIRIFQANIQASAAAPFIEVPAGAILFADMKENGSFLEIGGGPVVSLTDATSQLRTFQGEIAAVGTGAVNAVAGSTVIFNMQSASAQAELTSVVGGAVPTFGLVPNSRRVVYDDSLALPAIVGGGNSNVQAAIDALKTYTFSLSDADGDTNIFVENNPGADSDRITMRVGDNSGNFDVSNPIFDSSAPVGILMQPAGEITGANPTPEMLLTGAFGYYEGGLVRVKGGPADPSYGGPAGELQLQGGNAFAGGGVRIEGGTPQDTSGDGGAVVILASAGGSASTTGADVRIQGSQSSFFDQRGGNIELFAGQGFVSQDGGDVDINAGVGAGGASGGNIFLRAGDTVGAGTQGRVLIRRVTNVTGETGILAFEENDPTPNVVGFRAPLAIPADQIWRLPSADGTAGQAIITDGSGNLSFGAPAITGAWLLDGNTNGAERTIGTNDAFDFVIETSGTEKVRVDAATGDLTLQGELINMPSNIGIGTSPSVGGGQTIAIGENAVATAGRAMAIGRAAVVSGFANSESLAIGSGASIAGTTGGNSVAVGRSATITGAGNSVVIGADSNSSGLGGLAVGPLNTVSGTRAVAIGSFSSATQEAGVAIGWDADSTHVESVALGRSAATTADNQLMVGDTTAELNTIINGTLTASSSVGEASAVGTFTTNGAGGDSASLFVGTSSPNGSVTGDAGSLFLRDEGTTGQLWINTSTGSGTSWEQLASASSLNLQGAYDGSPSTDRTIVLAAGAGEGINVRDNAAPIGSNLFEVTDNAGTTEYLAVDATGVTIDGKLTVTGLIDPTGFVGSEQATSPYNPATLLTGTVSVAASGTAVTGTGTLFTTELAVSDFIVIAGETREVASITNDTSLTLVNPHTAGAAGVPYFLEGNEGTIWVSGSNPTTLVYTDSAGVDWNVAGMGAGTLQDAYDASSDGRVVVDNSNQGPVKLRADAGPGEVLLFEDSGGSQTGRVAQGLLEFTVGATDGSLVVSGTGFSGASLQTGQTIGLAPGGLARGSTLGGVRVGTTGINLGSQGMLASDEFVAVNNQFTDKVSLRVRGFAAQTENLLEAVDSASSVMFSVSPEGDTRIAGNLLVEGETTSTRSETVRIADNHLYLNDGYETAVAQTGGLVVNYLPGGTVLNVDTGGFTAGVAATSNPTVEYSGLAFFTPGQFIQVAGAADPNNDGLYELLSGSPTTITIRGIGLTGTVEDFTQNQFVTDTTAQGTITLVSISVIRAGTDGLWEAAFGSATPLAFGDVITTTTPTTAWLLGGNTVGSEERIGTNDAFDFVIETSGAERVRVNATTGDLTLQGDTINMPNNVAIGQSTSIGSGEGIVIGDGATGTSGRALAIGRAAVVSGASNSESIAIGSGASIAGTLGGNNVAVGRGATITGPGNSTVLGDSATSSALAGIAIGPVSSASGERGICIGSFSSATATASVALGWSADSVHTESVALGRDSTTTTTNQFMVGDSTAELNTFINGTLTLSSSVGATSSVATFTTTGVNGDSVEVFVGDIDPSAGGGVAAPVGSVFHRDSGGAGTSGELWLKTGAANTAWSLVGTGSGNSLQQAYEAGNTIVTDATNGDVDISGTEDFVVDMDGAVAITGDTAVTVTGGAVADASAVSVFLQGASSTGAGNAGGEVTVNAGNPGVGADGGGVTVTATAGNDTGIGGFVTISAGDSGAGATGDGGDIVASAGDAASTNGDGGSIILNPGSGAGTGTDGEVVVNGKLTVTGLIDPTGLVLTGQFASPANPATALTGTVSVTNTSLTGTVSVDVSQITGTVSTGETPLTGTVTVGVTSLTGTVTLGVTPLTGTVTVAAGTPNVIGAGTLFTSELISGDFIDIAGEIRQVGVINSDTSLTLLTNHVAGAAGVGYSLRFQDSTLNGTGTLFTVELSPGDTVEFAGQFRQVASITNDTTLDLTAVADSVQGVSATRRFASTAVTGTGTLFTTELSPGDMIRFNEEVVEVQSIANNTSLTLVNPHTNTALNETATLEALTTTVFGVGTLFTTELDVGDFLSVAGSTIEIASITNDTQLDLVSAHPSISNGQNATKFDSEVVGTGTLFTTETAVGRVLGISGGFYVVEAIANDTSLTIASPTPGPVSGVSAVSYDLTVTGTGTLFTTELSPGDFVSINGETAQVDSIASDTSLTLTEPLLVGASGDPIFSFGTDGTFWVDQSVSPTLPMFTDSAGVDHVLAYEDGAGPGSSDSRIEDGDGDTSVDVDPGGLDTDNTVFTNASQESMRITSGGFVGVGTSAPSTKLHVAGETDDAGSLSGEVASDAPEDFPSLDLCKAEGSLSSRNAVSNGSVLGAVTYKGYDGSAFSTGGEIVATASEDWSGGSNGTDFSIFLKENGTGTLQNRLTLTNGGNLGIGQTIPGARVAAMNRLGTALTGTVTVSAFSTSVTGTGTLFTTELRVGAPLRIDNEEFTVAAIASDTALTLSTPTAAGHLNSVALTDQTLFLFEDSQGTSRFEMDGVGRATIDGDLDITGKLTVAGLIDPTGLVLTEQPSDPASTGAGEGTFWVRNDSPNVPIFTDDAGVDHNLLDGGTSEAVAFSVNQTGHGFSVLDALSHDGSNFIAAQSDDASTLGYWLVYEVIDVDNFRVAYAGQVTVAAHGLTAGQFYFVSPTVAGDLTVTEPTTTGQFSNPLVYVRDANTLEVLAFRPSEVLSAPVAATLQSAYDNGNTIILSATSGDLDVSGTEAILLGASTDSNFTVDGGDLTLQANSGGSVFVLADEDAELRGGNTVLVRGANGTGSGDGALVSVISGDSGGAGGNGGDLTLQSGGGITDAGTIGIFGGDAGSGDGGFINLVAGDGGSQGGGLNFVGGTASAGDGGGVAFVGGGGNGATSTGGGVSFQGGVANTGGFVSFAGGASSPGGTGPGGSLMFNGGNAGAATNADGGGLTLTGGSGNGTGDGGDIVLSGGLGGATGTAGTVGVGAADPNVEFNIAGTGAVRVPVGTTAQRPATPPTGATRYNTSDDRVEIFDGADWLQLARMAPVVFRPQDSQPPVTNFATLSTRNTTRPHPLINFDPTTNESTDFAGYLPDEYRGGDLEVTIVWASTSSFGSVIWEVSWERQDEGIFDLDNNNFAAAQTGSDTAPGAQGVLVYTTITFTNAQADSMAAGECFRLRVLRDAATDTNAGEAQIIRVIVKEAL